MKNGKMKHNGKKGRNVNNRGVSRNRNEFRSLEPLDDISGEQEAIRNRIRMSGWCTRTLAELLLKCSRDLELDRAPTPDEYDEWVSKQVTLYPYSNQIFKMGYNFHTLRKKITRLIHMKGINGWSKPTHQEEKTVRKKHNTQRHNPISTMRRYFSHIAERDGKTERDIDKELISGVKSENDLVDVLLYHLDKEGYIPTISSWSMMCWRVGIPELQELAVKVGTTAEAVIEKAKVKAEYLIYQNHQLVEGVWSILFDKYLSECKRPPSLPMLRRWVESKEDRMIVPKNLFTIADRVIFYGFYYGEK
ncbi:hypothetical protein J7K41_00975 [Candidatus Micrarchaeota archaeon]|nr:hypothetical protein [Candidatus Micrarchaeota archaeon]